jgi:hypothetical protein
MSGLIAAACRHGSPSWPIEAVLPGIGHPVAVRAAPR